MIKIRSITDVVTNSSNETYVIRRDLESQFPDCDWDWGDSLDYLRIRDSKGSPGFSRQELVDMLSYGLNQVLIGLEEDYYIWKNSKWTEDQDLWRIFADVNKAAFLKLSEYSIVYGPEDGYEGYEEDWEEFRDLSIHTLPRG